MTARETLADTLNCVMPFHTNPLRVGPSVEGVDFVASSGPQETVTPLVAKRATWKWFAQGKNPPTGWNAMAFDDASWEEGAGVLGYGNEGGQATTIPFGPSSTAKWTGSFFRRAFVLDDPSRFPALRLEVLRDDGVVVYLNGHEIFRDNLPTGPVAYATQAGDAIEPDDYLVRTLDVASALPRGLLVAGTNYLTASVHQAGATSSDLAFDAALSGVAPLAGVGDAVVYLTTPLPGATESSLESIVGLSAVARVKNDTVAKVVFYGDGAVLGEDDTAPFSGTGRRLRLDRTRRMWWLFGLAGALRRRFRWHLRWNRRCPLWWRLRRSGNIVRSIRRLRLAGPNLNLMIRAGLRGQRRWGLGTATRRPSFRAVLRPAAL